MRIVVGEYYRSSKTMGRYAIIARHVTGYNPEAKYSQVEYENIHADGRVGPPTTACKEWFAANTIL